MRNTARKLLELIGHRRNRWLFLIFFAAGVSVLDAGAALLVFALLEMLSTPDSGLSLPVIGDLSRFIPGLDSGELLLVGAVGVAGIFLARSIAYITLLYLQHRVANNTGVEISTRLIRGYLAMPYAFHLRRNSAELVRDAFDAVQRLVGEVLVPLVRAVSEGLIVLAILIVLVAAAPAATALIVLVFTPTVFLLLRLVHPRLKRFGRTAQSMAQTSLQSLQQALGGVRDIKLLGRERHFVRDFAHHRRRLARARYLRGTATQLPRVVIETVLVVFVAAFIGFTLLSGGAPGDAFATLGLFGYGAFRALPSLTTVLSQLNSLKFSAAAIDDVHTDLRAFEGLAADIPEGQVQPLPVRREITMDNIHFRYEESHAQALEGVSLTVPRGATLGIVGPTGGGKTTMVDVLTGLLKPTAGRVMVDGADIHHALRGWQRNLGVVPQNLFLLDDTLRRNIAFGLSDQEIDDEKVGRAVQLAQLEGFVSSLPDGLDTVVGERGVRISGGQRQRVAIARALYTQPEVLIFDEATSALDNVTERAFMAGLAGRLGGRTLIMVAHRISTVRPCDRIVVVSGGRITDTGTYDELLERSHTFQELAGGGP